ncbi:MAG: glycosyltransferase, partial [Bacteroidota bacterium]
MPLSRMIAKLKKLRPDCEVILDLHFVIQKERSTIDLALTKRGLAKADTFIVHALNTFDELQQVFPDRKFELTYTGERDWRKAPTGTPVIKLFHPIYDLYQPDPAFDVAAFKAQHGLKENCFLYFGFIRKYKGLHNAIRAFAEIAKERDDVSFMICGELFWNTLAPDSAVAKLKKA